MSARDVTTGDVALTRRLLDLERDTELQRRRGRWPGAVRFFEAPGTAVAGSSYPPGSTFVDVLDVRLDPGRWLLQSFSSTSGFYALNEDQFWYQATIRIIDADGVELRRSSFRDFVPNITLPSISPNREGPVVLAYATESDVEQTLTFQAQWSTNGSLSSGDAFFSTYVIGWPG